MVENSNSTTCSIDSLDVNENITFEDTSEETKDMDLKNDNEVSETNYVSLILFGLLWAIGGSIATFVSYSSAASNSYGGTYFIFWGAIIFGAFDVLRGFWGLMTSN